VLSYIARGASAAALCSRFEQHNAVLCWRKRGGACAARRTKKGNLDNAYGDTYHNVTLFSNVKDIISETSGGKTLRAAAVIIAPQCCADGGKRRSAGGSRSRAAITSYWPSSTKSAFAAGDSLRHITGPFAGIAARGLGVT